ncbi:MAG: hypothetical protein ACKOA6_09930 [Actinomycetota bacterium]
MSPRPAEVRTRSTKKSLPAIIMLVVSLAGGVVTCGVASFVMGVIGLIEGIIYLTKTDAEFQAQYLDAQKEWF